MSTASVSRTHKIGSSRVVTIPKEIWDALAWRDGAQVAIRLAGEKLIIERIPLENFAILRGAPVGGAR